MSAEPMARAVLESEDLLREHRPAFSHPNKQLLFNRVTVPITGRLEVSRWRGVLPGQFSAPGRPDFEAREGFFQYLDAEAGTTSWHMNFADRELFGFYGGGLLAQDEHQVLEHPVLGSLREYLLEQHRDPSLVPRTRDYGPTPYLIKGAQRSIVFDTLAGPYGNTFSYSSPDRILAAATFPAPPTYSNIVAMVAPAGGTGLYSIEQLRDILLTAYVGFSACKSESGTGTCSINTGHWGCGAFGGNRVLMALLQLCASQLAQVDRLVYHIGSPEQRWTYEEALGLLDRLVEGSTIEPEKFIAEVLALGFEWGASDGN